MSKYDTIKQAALEANLRLPELGLVIFTFGNVSVADHALGAFAIKPSGVPYSELDADKMVVVDFDGKTLEGELRPSSDTLTHAVLYKAWIGIGSIVHTHSTYATAWAQAQKDIPILGTTHADHVAGDIPGWHQAFDGHSTNQGKGHHHPSVSIFQPEVKAQG